MIPLAVEECKPLVSVLSVGDIVVSDFGLRLIAGENGALADVADDAETEAFRWNVDGHLSTDEMGRGAVEDMGGKHRTYTRQVQTPHTSSAIVGFGFTLCIFHSRSSTRYRWIEDPSI